MAPANKDSSALLSHLAARRVERNLSQTALANLSGISLRTLPRLERKEVDNPPLRYLVNLSIVLH
jgi:transcriptional regulator with XRE-family HTH domain